MEITRSSHSTGQPGIPQLRGRHIQAYQSWLAKQVMLDHTGSVEQEIRRYQRQAAQTLHVAQQEICTFAPFHPGLSAWQTCTWPQVLSFSLVVAAWLIALFTWHWETLAWTTGTITCLYALTLMISSLTAFSAACVSTIEQVDERVVSAIGNTDWPLYTILCPLYKEAAIVQQFAQAMLALDYPPEKLQVLLLVEADDRETYDALLALKLPAYFQMVIVPPGTPRTKPRACNFGLLHARGRYVVIYDAEDIPDPLQLKKAVLTFAQCGSDVVCAQARLNCYNPTRSIRCGLTWYYPDYKNLAVLSHLVAHRIISARRLSAR